MNNNLSKLANIRIVFLFAFIFVFSHSVWAEPAKIDASSAPDQLIRALSDDILQTIKQSQTIRSGDINQITALVNTKLVPYIDVNETIRIIMGNKNFNKASQSQIASINELFKQLLIYTYAGAASQINNQSIIVHPAKTSGTSDEVRIRSVIIGNGNEYPVNYFMKRTAGVWKIYDLEVLGARLSLTYREQFKTILAGENGVQDLIKALQDRINQLKTQKH